MLTIESIRKGEEFERRRRQEAAQEEATPTVAFIADVETWCLACAADRDETWRNEHRVHANELSEADGVRCDQCGRPLLGPVPVAREFGDLWRSRVARRQRMRKQEREAGNTAGGDDEG